MNLSSSSLFVFLYYSGEVELGLAMAAGSGRLAAAAIFDSFWVSLWFLSFLLYLLCDAVAVLGSGHLADDVYFKS